MYLGLVELESNITIWELTKNTSNVPTAPTGSVTYEVYESGSDTPVVSSVAMTQVGSVVGFYRKSQAATAANGFERGATYIVKVSSTVSSNAISNIHTFTVT